MKLSIKRKPDFIIGRDNKPYMLRWHILPKNKWFNVYLHKFLGDDDDRALHDHPWWSVSIILRGGYKEHLPGGVIKHRGAPRITFRRAAQAHRIELYRDSVGIYIKRAVIRPAWTIFITGPRFREWGFYCPQGWVHHQDFVDARDPGKVGKGCNQ